MSVFYKLSNEPTQPCGPWFESCDVIKLIHKYLEADNSVTFIETKFYLWHLLLFHELLTDQSRIDLHRSIKKLGIFMMRPFETVCDHLQPFVTICDHLWPFATVCDHIRPFATNYDCFRPFANVCNLSLFPPLSSTVISFISPSWGVSPRPV